MRILVLVSAACIGFGLGMNSAQAEEQAPRRVINPNSVFELMVNLDQDSVSRIQDHLRFVIHFLQSRNLDHLNSAQKAARAEHLRELAGYADAGVFPQNKSAYIMRPVFIDDAGRECAVGYLMVKSGHAELAKTISLKQNLSYVGQIKVAGVVPWAKESGFSLFELALIQPTYVATIVQDFSAQSQGQNVLLTWTLGAEWVELINYYEIYRNDVLIYSDGFFPDQYYSFVDVDRPFGDYTYRLFAANFSYWDEDIATIDHQERNFIRGDANNNGEFEGLADSLFLLNYAFSNGAEPPCMAAADTDGNGEFQAMSDAIFGLYYVFVSGIEPPFPFPACAYDEESLVLFGCNPGLVTSCP